MPNPSIKRLISGFTDQLPERVSVRARRVQPRASRCQNLAPPDEASSPSSGGAESPSEPLAKIGTSLVLG
jgi:hypothetical protein